MTENTYRIEGMHCQNCVDKIENALKGKAKALRVTLSPPRLSVQGSDLKTLSNAIEEAGDYKLEPIEDETVPAVLEPSKLKVYYPLILVLAFILAGTILLSSRMTSLNFHESMADFMGLFFVFFAFFKLLDIPGFAQSYSSYDLLAQRWYRWGYIYPFIELGLGVGYLLRIEPFLVNAFTAGLMLFGALGIFNALRQRRKIQCACLGTVFNLPMTTVTLVEDLSMATMALFMLAGGAA